MSEVISFCTGWGDTEKLTNSSLFLSLSHTHTHLVTAFYGTYISLGICVLLKRQPTQIMDRDFLFFGGFFRFVSKPMDLPYCHKHTLKKLYLYINLYDRYKQSGLLPVWRYIHTHYTTRNPIHNKFTSTSL